TAGNVRREPVGRRWGPDVLWAKLSGLVAARCHLRGQDPERRKASRHSSRAADEVRVHHQSEGSQADWPNDSTQRACKSGSRDSVILDFRFWIAENLMNKKIVVFFLAASIVACFHLAEAQQQVPKIGFLGTRPAPASGQELWRELRELGYVEGKNLAIEFRYADNKLDRLLALADELSVSKLTCS